MCLFSLSMERKRTIEIRNVIALLNQILISDSQTKYF